MVVVCPVCRDVVHTSNGHFLSHGSVSHGAFSMCSGSFSPICTVSSDCCSI